jgi:hypothetical protein
MQLRFILAMGILASSSAYAGTVGVTISGTWGAVTSTPPSTPTTPFDNGSSFTFSTTITSLTPTSFNSGETVLPSAGGSYTNGAATVPVSVSEQLILLDPSVWNGEDFAFAAHDVFIAGDFLELHFNGPQLFSGPTSAPIVSSGSFQVQQAWYGWSGRYFGVDGCCSTALLVGDATITLSTAPEPSTGALMILALGAAVLQLRSAASRRGAPGDRAA